MWMNEDERNLIFLNSIVTINSLTIYINKLQIYYNPSFYPLMSTKFNGNLQQNPRITHELGLRVTLTNCVTAHIN